MQLRSPTTMKKAEIAEGILAILCGEGEPKRTKYGAPVKNVYVDPVILDTVAGLKMQYLNLPEVSAVYSREPDSETEPEAEGADIFLKLSVRYSTLSKRQKYLLNTFLESL